MSIKTFFIKQALRLKGISSDQAEEMAKKMEQNPELLSKMKKMQENKELMEIMNTISAKVDEKVKQGMDQMMATMLVMKDHASVLEKHKEELMPFLELMQK